MEGIISDFWGCKILLSSFLLFFSLIGIVQFSMMFYTRLKKPISDNSLYYIIPLQKNNQKNCEEFLRSCYGYAKWNSRDLGDNIVILNIDACQEDQWIAQLFAKERGLIYLENLENLHDLYVCKKTMTVLY